jgi:carboxypeptidase D
MFRAVFITHACLPPTIHAHLQYKSYGEFVELHGLLPQGAAMKELAELTAHCTKLLLPADEAGKPAACEKIMDVILSNTRLGEDARCINIYDVRLHDEHKEDGCGLLAWPKGVKEMTGYLNQNGVRSALHAEPSTFTQWAECRTLIQLQHDTSPPSMHLIPDLLAKVKVLLFSGDQDLICNWLGTRDSIAAMTWGWEGRGSVVFLPLSTNRWGAVVPRDGSSPLPTTLFVRRRAHGILALGQREYLDG